MDIVLKDLKSYLNRGPSIVVGPGLTTYPTIERECLEMLKQQYPNISITAEVKDAHDYAEKAVETEGQRVRDSVLMFYKQAARSAQIDRAVSGNWSAVISLTTDDYFRSSLRSRLDSQPLSWAVTSVAKHGAIIPPRTIPVFQPLGDPHALEEDTRLVVTKSEYLARRRYWRDLFRPLPDYVRGDPLLFVGTSMIVDKVVDLLNELLALGGAMPRKIMFFADDPSANDTRITSLLRGYCDILKVKGSLTDFCDLADQKSPLQRQSATASKDEPFDFSKLLAVEDQVAVVPLKQHIDSASHRNRLLDILFSPSKLDWSPYHSDLDFVRECAAEIEHAIETKITLSASDERHLLVKGEAGVGKTTTMRRVAFNLAQKNYLCLWIRRGYGELSGGRFETVVKAINSALRGKTTNVVFFYDDPRSGRITIRELCSALGSATFRWVAVFGSRNTDVAGSETDALFSWSAFEAIEIPIKFTESELHNLPAYLVNLGIGKDVHDAKSVLSRLGVNAKDILCTLWYLLPQTRAAISASLTDEYLRLSGNAGPIQLYANAATDAKGIAGKAYELVTTTSGFDTSVPVEVLASALGISIGHWCEMCSANKPLWGLLYDEPYPTADTFGYTTRNEVVTKVLLSLLNGGTMGHAGEYKCLSTLIRACSCGNPPYREFLCDILIRHKKQLEQRFTYEQGLELYDAALITFPAQDRAIAHHRALWIKDVGRLPDLAYQELERVQRIASYSHSSKTEPTEHIHTSMAASVFQAISSGKMELSLGVELIKQHIAKASSPFWFDAHSAHVHANTLLKLSASLRMTDSSAFVDCVHEATSIIDRTLLVVEPMADSRPDLREALKMFHELQGEVLMAYSSPEEAEAKVTELFQKTRNQTGFVLVARMLIGMAAEKSKGGLFKKAQDFVNRVMAQVERNGDTPIPELFLCRAELMIKWRVLSSKGGISWIQVCNDLIESRKSPRFERDPIWTFFLAVAYYHLTDYGRAEGLFAQLKSLQVSRILKYPFRCFLIADDGTPKTFQGVLKCGAALHKYIQSTELKTDVHAKKEDFHQQEDATVHFRVVFSMMGPLAISHLKDKLPNEPYTF